MGQEHGVMMFRYRSWQNEHPITGVKSWISSCGQGSFDRKLPHSFAWFNNLLREVQRKDPVLQGYRSIIGVNVLWKVHGSVETGGSALLADIALTFLMLFIIGSGLEMESVVGDGDLDILLPDTRDLGREDEFISFVLEVHRSHSRPILHRYIPCPGMIESQKMI